MRTNNWIGLGMMATVAMFSTLSGCAPRAEDAVVDQSELNNSDVDPSQGAACCAKDYRDGNGETVVCGTRDHGFCCNAANTECFACWYYECVGAEEAPTRPVRPPVRSPIRPPVAPVSPVTSASAI